MNTSSANERPTSTSCASLPRTWLKFWGVRGSIPTPGQATVHYGGNTSCVEIRVGNEIVILDAGTGLRLLGQALVAEFDGKPMDLTLLLTHTHWDHIQGLPFFLPVYRAQCRLRILGYEGARQGLEAILTGQMEHPFFPVGLGEVPANVRIEELKEPEFRIGSIRVRACRASHPGQCFGYRLFTARGSIAFFPDHEARQGSQPGTRGAQTAKEGAQRDRTTAEFLRGADLLIMDAQYDLEEYRPHLGWGHGCLDEVVALALEAEVKRLFLFHHDPDHDDAKVTQMVARARELVAARQGTLQVEGAREGVVVELGGGC